MSSSATGAFLAGTFLARLKDSERTVLHEQGAEHTFARGAVLMYERELEERVMVLLSGRVKITRVSHDGRELLLSIRDPGDVLGELALIDREPRTATVTALEPVLAVVLSGSAFRSYLEATPRVAVVLLEIVAGRFRQELNERMRFSETDTMGRLATRLLQLAARYGEQTEEGTLVAVPVSQEELASWVGASRAGVAQALQSLRELGWIKTEKRMLLVTDAPARAPARPEGRAAIPPHRAPRSEQRRVAVQNWTSRVQQWVARGRAGSGYSPHSSDGRLARDRGGRHGGKGLAGCTHWTSTLGRTTSARSTLRTALCWRPWGCFQRAAGRRSSARRATHAARDPLRPRAQRPAGGRRRDLAGASVALLHLQPPAHRRRGVRSRSRDRRR